MIASAIFPRERVTVVGVLNATPDSFSDGGRLIDDTGAVDVDAPGKFAVIPPGVNTQIFTTEPGEIDRSLASGLLREVLAAPRPMVVVSNRLDEKKNTIGVVEAFAASESLRQRAGLLLCFRGIDDPFAEIRRRPPLPRE